VKETVEDKMLKELFRHKLENAEVTPSAEAGAKLMSRLARREFLRFNPTRINIWYAGIFAVAGTVLALVLSNHKAESRSIAVPPVQTEQAAAVISQNPVAEKVQLKSEPGAKSTSSSLKVTGKTIKAEAGKIIKPAGKELTAENNTGGTHTSVNEANLIKGAIVDNKPVSGLNHKYISLSAASVSEGCTPLRVSFKNLSTVYDSCCWTFGDGGSSVEKNPVWIYDVPGEYKVTLTIIGSGGQVSASSLNVTVHGHPDARFEFTPVNAVLPSDEISFHNYSGDAVGYRWDFGDGTSSELFEPTHSYSKAGKFTVKMVAVNDFGCSDSVMVKNAFAGTGNYINFPNAFVPNLNGPLNGTYSQKIDETAQVFHPVSSGVSEYQLKIFSRRGILIFESNDVNIGWDGYLNGQLCEAGVYIWKARGTFLNGETFTRMGDVTLLKY
jgi:PKD repeat protein